MNQGKPPRRAFQEATPAAPQKKLQLTLDNKQSMTESLPKPPTHEEGQLAANKANDRLNEYAEMAAKLTLDFKKVASDKTLPINKSIIARDAEKSLIGQMVGLGTQMNNDVRQEEGQGSMAMITLLIGYVLLHRDQINELAYADEQHAKKIMQLETQNKMLDQQIKALTLQVSGLDKQKAND